MKSVVPPKPPPIPPLRTFSDLVSAIKKIYEYSRVHAVSDLDIDAALSQELSYLYGEYVDSSPAPILNGAQSILTATVSKAILGYTAEVSYDQDLQGLQLTAFVSGDDTVKIVLKNDTGGTITLTAGVFRVFVWPRLLSSTTP